MNKVSSFTIIVAFVCLSLVGLVLVPLLPVKLSPSQSLPRLTVTYEMRGNSSRVIESEVTSLLEGMLARVKGIEHIQSTSSNGRGSITLQLDKHADIDQLRFEVSTIIRQTWPQLPSGVSYPLITTQHSDDTADTPFMVYTLNAPVNPVMIQQYAEENVKPVLAQLGGIYKVELNGATPMEWQLEYDGQELARMGIDFNTLQQAIISHYGQEFMGICSIERGSDGTQWIRLVKASEGDTHQFRPSDIRLTTQSGQIVTLDKFITVKHVEQLPNSYYRINGLNSIYMNITAQETANQLQLAKKVKEQMARLSALMPSGYEVHISYDATQYINEELQKIYFRTSLTVLILLLFVAIITLNLRYLFLIVCSLTVNIAVAAIFYYLLGLEIQLYSLAGITISLNLVIDNTIVMSDHLMRRHNLRAFMSILAATLTTIGALVIIFFMDEEIRLNLQDFAAVVIVNLAVSLAVALFFVPALMNKIRLERRPTGRRRLGIKRWVVRFTQGYRVLISTLVRHRVITCLLLVLAFGLPVFLVPEKVKGESHWAKMYNSVFQNETFKNDVRPVIEKALGGILRLFVDKVRDNNYFGRGVNEVVLSVYATLPNGSTISQMNALITRMETYLSNYPQIRQFQTRITSPYQARIQIYFKKEYERSGFPYTLKSDIISQALTLGGGSWTVTGLQDQGFSNDVREMAGSMRVTLYGYNYDELYAQAERFKEVLLQHRRIREVIISSEYSYYKTDYSEFSLQLHKERMAREGLTAFQLFAALQPIFARDMNMGTITVDGSAQNLKLTSQQSTGYDAWGLVNMPLHIGGRDYKLSDFATVEKGQSPQEIAKEDQQYRLCVQYEYVGSSEQGRKLLDADIEQFKPSLPMGYSIESQSTWYSFFSKKSASQYALLFIVIAIIFFTSSILFNSLVQPLAIIFVIPISYIGVFLTFYLFHLGFDQGGFASFVLLCGITVNASIYILGEYNSIRRRYPRLNALKAYTKAWNTKVIPIFLTVVSTILGFVPFLVGTGKEAFWYTLASGTIGGLIMSVIGIFFFLPIFTLKKGCIIRKPKHTPRRARK